MISQKQEIIINSAVAEYLLNGMCVVKGLFDSNEIKILQEETLRLWAEQEACTPNNLRIGIRKDQDGKDVLERLDPVVDISEIFSDLNEDARILKLAQDALLKPIMVLKEKLIYKWPGNGGYGTHRDETYFSVTEDGPVGNEILTILVSLDKANSENGALRLYPTLRHKELASAKEESRDIDDAELENAPFFMPNLNPGDIIVFNGTVPHNSDSNKSDRSRRSYMITFAPKKYVNCRVDYYHFRHQELSRQRQKDYKGEFYIR